MRNYKKYRTVVISTFQSFLKGDIKESDLINKLSSIELELKGRKRTNKGLWFRFYNNDTGATTINNISRWLYCGTNRESIKEDFRIAINNPKELKIHYS